MVWLLFDRYAARFGKLMRPINDRLAKDGLEIVINQSRGPAREAGLKMVALCTNRGVA